MTLLAAKVYLVGGAVRDQLLEYPVKERDWVVVGATAEHMRQAGFKQVGKDFPVFLHPETGEEYALARTERKTGKGYTGFSCDASPTVTLEQDLQRRDLTINAMAMTAEGELIDPWGGENDLRNKVLRHVSPAFTEDPLRILRLARFFARYASLGFKIAAETQILLLRMVREGDVTALTPERVWQECLRALQTTEPERFIEVLRQCGALKILLPEIDTLFGVPNPAQWHQEIDSGLHTLMVLQQAVQLSSDPIVRFAALVHDVGKGITPYDSWPSHRGHDIQGVKIIKQLCQRLRVPRAFEELASMVSQHHINVHSVFDMRPATLISFLERLDAFRKPQRLHQFLLACEADSRGRLNMSDQPYPQRAYLESIYDIAKEVAVAPILEEGFEGEAIAQQLHQRRVQAVRSYVEKQRKQEP